ncbi:MAG: alpha/beta hydrolase [Spirochaetales bacterium]|nr:alpha/beta hydrolase [Spirochaetales bacterium]
MKKKVLIKYYEDDEHKIRYFLSGNQISDHCLLFLNGLYHDHSAWTKQQSELYFHENYKMVFIDYRGCGDSINKSGKQFDFFDIVNDILLIIKQENIEHVTLIGHSSGGMLALWFSSQYPQYIENMVLLNTGAYLNNRLKIILKGLIQLIDEGAELSDLLLLVYPWHFSRLYAEKISTMWPDIYLKYAAYNRDLVSLKYLIQTIINAPDITSILNKITFPVLVIGSDNDYIFPAIHQNEIAEQVKNCECVILPGNGHAAFIENHKDVNTLIKRHLVKSNAYAIIKAEK